MASLDRQLTAEPVSAPRGRWRDYTQLSGQIRQAGLLDRRRGCRQRQGRPARRHRLGEGGRGAAPPPASRRLCHRPGPGAVAAAGGGVHCGQQGLFGLYLGCSFAPNHKGMPTLSYADQLDFVRRQVLTSRNVRGSRLVDFVLGGLNYQIEHHLFPNMPRPNLRHAQPLIRAFCQQRGIGYREASLLGSYAEAVRHLHTIGAPLRPAQAAAD
jgi:hypothetical protein